MRPARPVPSLFLGPRCTRGPRVRLWVGGLEPDCLAPRPKLEAQGPRRQCRPGWARLRRRLRSLTGKERESGLLSALRDGPPSWDPCRCLSFPQPGVCYFLTVHVRPWRLILEPPGSQGKGGAHPAPGARPLEAQARDWAEQETVLAGGDLGALVHPGAPGRGRLCPPATAPCPWLLCSRHCSRSLYLLRWPHVEGRTRTGTQGS